MPTDKKIKPQTEIRNLKRELAALRIIAIHIGLPQIVAYMPETFIEDFSERPTKEEVKWVKSRIKEFKKLFPKK